MTGGNRGTFTLFWVICTTRLTCIILRRFSLLKHFLIYFHLFIVSILFLLFRISPASMFLAGQIFPPFYPLKIYFHFLLAYILQADMQFFLDQGELYTNKLTALRLVTFLKSDMHLLANVKLPLLSLGTSSSITSIPFKIYLSKSMNRSV